MIIYYKIKNDKIIFKIIFKIIKFCKLFIKIIYYYKINQFYVFEIFIELLIIKNIIAFIKLL